MTLQNLLAREMKCTRKTEKYVFCHVIYTCSIQYMNDQMGESDFRINLEILPENETQSDMFFKGATIYKIATYS